MILPVQFGFASTASSTRTHLCVGSIVEDSFLAPVPQGDAKILKKCGKQTHKCHDINEFHEAPLRSKPTEATAIQISCLEPTSCRFRHLCRLMVRTEQVSELLD